jgi:hypothetical protein
MRDFGNGLLRLLILLKCRSSGLARQGYEIADDRGAIIPPMGKADRRAGGLAFNA